MRVLISGCGYLGSALGLLLTAEGHTVFGLRRNTKALPPTIKPISADLSKPLPPDALPPNLDAAVHAVSPGNSKDEAYTQGPRNLLVALEPQRETLRFIFVSSTGVYAQKKGEWVDEDSPATPETNSGRRLLEGERLVLGGPLPATVLRLGGIYGPGRTGTIERALRTLRKAPQEDPPRYTNRIHRDDCAGSLRHLILFPDPDPLYLGVDHEPATLHTIAEWLAARPDVSPSETGTPQNGPRGASRSRTNKRCSNARLIHSGYHFLYPTFREGFAALL